MGISAQGKGLFLLDKQDRPLGNAKGVTVVMITHDMHLMLEYTPRALAFCDGRLIADRSAAAILCDPALIEQAALKETSLYTLANRCGITPAEKFVERFIAADRGGARRWLLIPF